MPVHARLLTMRLQLEQYRGQRRKLFPICVKSYTAGFWICAGQQRTGSKVGVYPASAWNRNSMSLA